MNTMTEAKLELEKAELSIKIINLEAFLTESRSNFQCLDDYHSRLLEDQLEAMHTYLSILEKRLGYE
jgi:hypothetical protein